MSPALASDHYLASSKWHTASETLPYLKNEKGFCLLCGCPQNDQNDPPRSLWCWVCMSQDDIHEPTGTQSTSCVSHNVPIVPNRGRHVLTRTATLEVRHPYVTLFTSHVFLDVETRELEHKTMAMGNGT